MTDRGERKVRELALKCNGEAWDTNDVKELIFAFADDQEDDHKESMDRLEAVEAAVADHVEWTDRESLPRLRAVESGLSDVESRCTGHDALHVDHLATNHVHAPRRAGDQEDVDFESKREGEELRVSFRAGKYILGALVVIALTVLINYVVIYRGQQTQLATSRGNAAALSVLVRQQHQDTADLLNLLSQEHSTTPPTPTP